MDSGVIKIYIIYMKKKDVIHLSLRKNANCLGNIPCYNSQLQQLGIGLPRPLPLTATLSTITPQTDPIDGTFPAREHKSLLFTIIEVFLNHALSSTSPRTNLPWATLPGADIP